MKRSTVLRAEAGAYVQECLKHGSPPHVNELAARLGMSAAQLSKEFLREVGEHASAHLKRQRMMCAQEFLAKTSQTIEEIAHQCGLELQLHFIAFFSAQRA